MAEQPVFWLGGKPGSNSKKEPQRPEAERYEPALRDACSACGYTVDEYIAAQGGFGGWLAHLERDGQRYRIFWSGKDERISFERARPSGGWDELAVAKLGNDGAPGFVAAVQSMLDSD